MHDVITYLPIRFCYRAIHSSVYNALKTFADISPRLYDSCTLEYNERIQKCVSVSMDPPPTQLNVTNSQHFLYSPETKSKEKIEPCFGK
jgi:hypothetical protein